MNLFPSESPALRQESQGQGLALLARQDDRLFTAVHKAPSSADASMNTQALLPAGVQVLVADDNPANQYEVGELLACMGATVLLAADGEQAVRLACGSNVDLVLMDLQMPVLDGLGATKKIRQYERENECARLPVIAYTSCAFGAHSTLLHDCGFDAILDKPCTQETLRECMARWRESRHIGWTP
jgi:CheY-like chemotaxis protein